MTAINYEDEKTQRVIGWIAENYPTNCSIHMWTMPEIILLIKETQVINPGLDMQQTIQAQASFVNTFFDKRAYYWLKPSVAVRVQIHNDPDPIWREHLELTLDIKENLYSTPFMIKCDDEDFLNGALQTALAEVGELNWFDWYIELHTKGDDEGDYWEIKHFEEDA